MVVYSAVVTLFLLYHLSRSADWETPSPTIYRGYEPPVEQLRQPSWTADHGSDRLVDTTVTTGSTGSTTAADPSTEAPSYEDAAAAEVAPTAEVAPVGTADEKEVAKEDVAKEEVANVPTPAQKDNAGSEAPIHRVNPPGAFQKTTLPAGVPTAASSQTEPSPTAIHWQKMPEHFPVPAESLIQLPTGVPKAIPRIQYDFSPETEAVAHTRKARLLSVRDEMLRAWRGYRTYAWTHDELVPLSKTFRDPFCGWAASLVDALDTLWIMGLRDDFDDAYEAVKNIDFTTTPYRPQIPVFETIIRYLGGLIAAYDVTGGKDGNYPALLDKAVELAEVLMGVFDTPNRMPVLYYRWEPLYASQPKMADTATGIAELGSMTMEFTRLAQLTGQDKYYDAIARIVDALEEWQSREGEAGTAVPGIFPEHVDASGCNRSAAALQQIDGASKATQAQAAAANDLDKEPVGYQPSQPQPQPQPQRMAEPMAEPMAPSPVADAVTVKKRAVIAAEPPSTSTYAAPSSSTAAVPNAVSSPKPLRRRPVGSAKANGETFDWTCKPQNLTPTSYGAESYSMGGSQDSTYEYFPKVGRALLPRALLSIDQ